MAGVDFSAAQFVLVDAQTVLDLAGDRRENAGGSSAGSMVSPRNPRAVAQRLSVGEQNQVSIRGLAE
jgi:hypothetical protein